MNAARGMKTVAIQTQNDHTGTQLALAAVCIKLESNSRLWSVHEEDRPQTKENLKHSGE